MKRSFQSLSPQEALHVAVFIEERNSLIYHQFAEMFVSAQEFGSLELAGVLWDMAVEERHHSTLLQDRYNALFGRASCALTDADILEIVEMPQLMNLNMFDSSAESAHLQALRLALCAEKQARSFYTEIVETVDDPDLRALYAELSNFEADHVEFLERKLAKQQDVGISGEGEYDTNL